MTDPIPDEAVEAAARVMADDGWTCEYHEPDEGCTVCREAHRHTAIAILTAAAPLIAAQATAVPAENLQIIGGYLVQRGVHEPDYPAGPEYGAYPNSDAAPLVKLDDLPGWPGDAADLRARIEALRDEWRASIRPHPNTPRPTSPAAADRESCADALDALIGGGAMPKRCDTCGRFADHLNDVWITQPYPSIDREVCDRCYGSGDLVRAIAVEYIMEHEPSPERAR